MVQKYIKIHSDDLVAVALCPLEIGLYVMSMVKRLHLLKILPKDINLRWKILKKISLLLNMDIRLVSQRKISSKEAGFIHTTWKLA